MKLTVKILLILIPLYILIGIVYAISFSIGYTNGVDYSVPNNVQTFIMNTFLWPLSL